MKCGLLGERLSHSQSPEIHRRLGAYDYRLYEKRPEEVETFIRTGDYDVLNITVPYKRMAFALCDETSELARRLGNVNLVVRRLDGRLWGDNTDFAGFAKMLDGVFPGPLAGRKCLVLGSGGASATVRAVLEDRGGKVVTISRTGADNYQNLDHHADAALLANATPVGMFPDADAQPVSLASFPHLEAVLDLVYNPSPTRLLGEAAARGIPCAGGRAMLEEQARLSSLHMNVNLYLYGPPGVGKTTFGRCLAMRKGMDFVDLDEEIERAVKRTVAEIFAAGGEAEFRRLEAETFRRIAAVRNRVVALGGGTLLDCESRRLAEASGRVVLLVCDEAELLRRIGESSTRPLLAGNAAERLHALLSSRRAHYASFSLERLRIES